MTKEELIAFEDDIAALFLDKKIRAAIHLSRGNEEQLLEIFRWVRPGDWVFSYHRSHYHALLKGISPKWLRREILEGRSICIFNKEHRFFASAIVGGCIPIALGAALAIDCKGIKRHVWCFVGDMAGQTGIFHECTKYAENFNLPIVYIVEDNGLSVNTPTREVWGIKESKIPSGVHEIKRWGKGGIYYYCYERGYPHSGTGKWLKF
jgi:TPP-dependent pyruvate/acetoin dehydrogenase alpha subunit